MKIESAKQIGFDFCPDNCPYADIQHSETKLYAGEDVFSAEMNVYCGNKELCRMVYALVKQDKEVETTECDAINELKELKEYLLTEERREACDLAIAALEKQEKYKWHDLRENPKDLPQNDIEYLICEEYDGGDKYIELCFYDTCSKSWNISYKMIDHIIAWKEIESFEEGDKK